jgi:hypothetical protein
MFTTTAERSRRAAIAVGGLTNGVLVANHQRTIVQRSGDMVVSPGKPLNLTVDFTPRALGVATQTIQIASSIAGSRFELTLKGVGVKGDTR